MAAAFYVIKIGQKLTDDIVLFVAVFWAFLWPLHDGEGPKKMQIICYQGQMSRVILAN